MDIVVDDFKLPSHRISSDGKHSAVLQPDHRRTKLSRFPRFNLHVTLFSIDGGGYRDERSGHAHPPYCISTSKGFYFPLLIVRHEPQVRDTDLRAPFPLEDLGWGDNTFLSSVHGYQHSPRCKGSGSCRSLPSVSRFQRWSRRPKLGSWLERVWQRGEYGAGHDVIYGC